ncbi:MAG: DUF2807 domain-containing protein [Bacteroidetes bacterium]|nr:DUF2807 domain-containing protein [Bacteroidota bacterium]
MNTIKKFTGIFMLSLIALMSSCDFDGICTQGTGPLVTDTLQIASFTGIELSTSADVYISKGATQLVEVRGQQNLIDILETDVTSDVWKIDFPGCVRNMDDLEIYITLPELTYAKISGSGNIVGQDTFSTSLMELKISGAGDISLEAIATQLDVKISGSGNMILGMDTDQLTSEINGAGDLYLQGTAETHYSLVRGSGNIEAFDLVTDHTEVKISGAGDAEVTANLQLDVNISGSGNVYYKGNPAINADIKGSGHLQDAN